MRRILACALIAAGCGETEPMRGRTFVTIAPVLPYIHFLELMCAADPPPIDDDPATLDQEVSGDPSCEFDDAGACYLILDPPSGVCTLHIRVVDQLTGETICVQDTEFVVAELGDTEVDITVDDCEPVPDDT